jgi:hypothetical protein
MANKDKQVEGEAPKASFNELVAEKRKAGLTRDQAESVARRQLLRDAENAKSQKTEAPAE